MYSGDIFFYKYLNLKIRYNGSEDIRPTYHYSSNRTYTVYCFVRLISNFKEIKNIFIVIKIYILILVLKINLRNLRISFFLDIAGLPTEKTFVFSAVRLHQISLNN